MVNYRRSETFIAFMAVRYTAIVLTDLQSRTVCKVLLLQVSVRKRCLSEA